MGATDTSEELCPTTTFVDRYGESCCGAAPTCSWPIWTADRLSSEASERCYRLIRKTPGKAEIMVRGRRSGPRSSVTSCLALRNKWWAVKDSNLGPAD